jgi:hypothetical protein
MKYLPSAGGTLGTNGRSTVGVVISSGGRSGVWPQPLLH